MKPTPKGGAEAPSKPVPSPRDELIARMAARVAEARGETALPADPEAPVEDEVPDSARMESIEEPASEPAKEAPEPDDKALADPFAEFLVVTDGKAMVKLKVDGVERLVPLDAARATLQKHEAADKRLQAAAEQQKVLAAREAALQAKEAELLSRTTKTSQLPSQDADDPNLDEEARELAYSLLNSTEDEVAASLKKVLQRRQATPAVDVEAIVNRAAQTAELRAAERTEQERVQMGWQQFQKDYPDIAADAQLLVVADRLTDGIAAEHPEWGPAQVMAEAGERTRTWLKGVAPAASSQPSDRQKMKETLRPMPQSRTGRIPSKEPEKPKTPAEILAEVRKARGQGA